MLKCFQSPSQNTYALHFPGKNKHSLILGLKVSLKNLNVISTYLLNNLPKLYIALKQKEIILLSFYTTIRLQLSICCWFHHYVASEEVASGLVLLARCDRQPSAKKKRIQEGIDGKFSKLNHLDPSLILKNNISLNEDQALLLLSWWMSLHSVVIFNLAFDV